MRVIASSKSRRRLGPIPLVLLALAVCASQDPASKAAEASRAGPRPAEAPLYMTMTDEDVRLADSAVQQALEKLPSGARLDWRSALSGNGGSIIPTATFRTVRGYYCRRYRETVSVGGRTDAYTDTACRDDRGRWVPVR